jgi:hypothetical protein
MSDLTTILGEAAAVVDPKGENDAISILCGLVAWAVDHPDEYEGWDAETLATALRPNFDSDPDEADEIARQLVLDNGS